VFVCIYEWVIIEIIKDEKSIGNRSYFKVDRVLSFENHYILI